MGRMVGDADFRSSLVNEAHELVAFLQMRLAEGRSAQILGVSHDLLDPVLSAALKQWLQVRPPSSTPACEQTLFTSLCKGGAC